MKPATTTPRPPTGRPCRSPLRIAQVARGLGLIFAVTVLPSGCVYRFTNEHIVRPEGIRTIAVEAIYDTSREVIPHELLWEALQEAFAADGNLRLAPQATADALLRAHIKEASVTPSGVEKQNGATFDPRLDDPADPPAPGKFRPMTQAGQYREMGHLALVVEIEVWSLRTRTVLMKRSYPLAIDLRAIRSDQRVTTETNDFLRYDEAVGARLKTLSQNVSRVVVQDLLVP